MSVVSKNPFELLGDDEPRSSSPAPKAKAAAAAPAKEAPKVVPGAAPKGGNRGGRYPARGGPRNVYREDRPVEASEPGFEGERVAPPKKSHQGRDRHTKGPRDDRQGTGPRSRVPGAAGARGPKGQGRGPRGGAAEPAQGDKKPTENWGNAEGKAELTAETQGEKDGAEAAAKPEEAEEVEAEEEDTSKTLDQYLAERAQQALGGELGKKEARQVSADDVEGKTFEREEIEGFFTGKATGNKAPKQRKEKAEKVYIAVDGQFAQPARAPRGDRGDRPARGRGGPRGRGGAAARGGAQPRKQAAAAPQIADESAFPSLS